MKDGQMYVRRQILLASASGLILAAIAPSARALTGIAALDTPAIHLKSPANVLLVAITLTPGNRLVAVGEHGVVVYSDDNGARWVQGSVPVNVTLTCVAFATAEIGWAAGHFGVILNTQDGGKSWREQLNGIEVNQLTEAAATAPSIATDPAPGAPLAARRARHFLDNGPDEPFLTMLVFSAQKVIMFGAYRIALLSNDGGKSWVDWDLHIYDKYSHNIYDAAFIGGIYYLVAEEGLIFGSVDGANTFLPRTAPGSTTIFGILGAKDGSLIVFGVAGFAARSTDSCKTWATLTIATQNDLAGGRVLASGTIVLVDEVGLVFQSTDNGVTFTRVRGINPAPFFDLQQAPDGSVIAVGAAGITQIAKTMLT